MKRNKKTLVMVISTLMMIPLFTGCGKQSAAAGTAGEDVATLSTKAEVASAEDDTATAATSKTDAEILQEFTQRLENSIERLKANTKIDAELKDKIVAKLEDLLARVESDTDLQKKIVDRIRNGPAVHCDLLTKLLSNDKLPQGLRDQLQARYDQKCAK